MGHRTREPRKERTPSARRIGGGAPARPRTSLRWKLLTVAGLAAAVWLLNAWWLSHDSRPPVWDMAAHQSYALNFLGGRFADPAGIPVGQLSGVYPPLVHWLIALAFAAFGADPSIAPLANVPATVLLFWAVYELGERLASAWAARWSCVLTAAVPYLVWMSRETVLDYWLTAWVAAGLAVLLRTNGFRDLRASLVLGVTLALGLLTKWIYPVFLLFPLVYVAIRERVWRSRLQVRNAALASLCVIVLSGIWYLPRLTALAHYFSENAQVGALEGEPEILSFQSFVYYVRLLEGYQLFALLFGLFAVSWGMIWQKRCRSDCSLVAWTIVVSWLGLTLIRTKDPRFSMPLLPLLTIAPAAWIATWPGGWKARLGKAWLVLVLCFQIYLTNAGVSWLPEQVILLRGYQGSLRWDWNLYLQQYFDILGPPRLEHWKQEEILSRIDADASETGLRRSLGVVVDLPRFSAANFHLSARFLGLPIRVYRLVLTERGVLPLAEVDYVLTTDGQQGMAWTTGTAAALTRLISQSDAFRLVARFPLPDGSNASLFATTPVIKQSSIDAQPSSDESEHH